MRLEFESFITTLLASFLLFLIAYFLFVRSKRILTIGYHTLTVVCVLSVLRLLFPFEFSFGSNLHLNKMATHIVVIFRRKHMLLSTITFSLFDIGILVWMLGIIIGLYKYIKTYKRDHFLIHSLGVNVSNNDRYSKLLTCACQYYHLNRSFDIYEIDELSSPMIFSIRKPTILLPAQNQYTDQELIFIFRHEVGHFYYHHLLYHFGVELFSIVYWWNPLNKYIKKQIDTLLEMSIDHSFSSSADETIAYLNCLLKVKKQSAQQQLFPKLNSSLSMNNLQESMLEKRFQLLTHSQKRQHFLSVFVVVISVSIYLFSYYFTLRGVSTPSEAKNNEIFTLTNENSYGISNGDGTYDLYLYGEYIETVDSLMGYDYVPIYNSLEDVPQPIYCQYFVFISNA